MHDLSRIAFRNALPGCSPIPKIDEQATQENFWNLCYIVGHYGGIVIRSVLQSTFDSIVVYCIVLHAVVPTLWLLEIFIDPVAHGYMRFRSAHDLDKPNDLLFPTQTFDDLGLLTGRIFRRRFPTICDA